MVPRAVLGQNGLKKTAFRDFQSPGVRSAKTEKVKKLRNFGDKLLGRPDCFLKSAPSTGKLHGGPEFLYMPKAKTGRNTTKSPFPTGGGPTEKKIVLAKVAENHPGLGGNIFFSISGPLLLWGPGRDLRGYLLLACLLLARRASSTPVV